jgi:hypothetical protein
MQHHERMLSQVIDDAQTRPEIDKGRSAMNGASWGAFWATKMARHLQQWFLILRLPYATVPGLKTSRASMCRWERARTFRQSGNHIILFLTGFCGMV